MAQVVVLVLLASQLSSPTTNVNAGENGPRIACPTSEDRRLSNTSFKVALCIHHAHDFPRPRGNPSRHWALSLVVKLRASSHGREGGQHSKVGNNTFVLLQPEASSSKQGPTKRIDFLFPAYSK